MPLLWSRAVPKNTVNLRDHLRLTIRSTRRTMSNFRIHEHVVRCQHTRDRPAGAERGHENDLKLHVKQYIPRATGDAQPGDVTIIGAQANAFPREMYEPLWDDLYERMHAQGKRIRGIWIADMASQGRSGIINEEILGPDASWWDHGRDLMYLINQFQDDMPHPIVGIGHSVGASHLAHLSLMHPRLLDAIIMVDPIFQRDIGPHTAFARLSTNRRDIWPSRKAAAEKFRSSKFYSAWDARVLDKWIEYGLRDLPTEQYPQLPEGSDTSEPPVTLSTTTAQEVYFYLRAYYKDPRLLQDESFVEDIHPDDRDDFPLSRPESAQLYRQIPELKPSALYIFGETSEASPPEYRRDKLARTGTGIGGSGGAARGRVSSTVLDCGHLVCMEKPTECAEACVPFIAEEMERWERQQREWGERLARLNREQRVGINDLWRRNLGVADTAKAPRSGNKL